MPILDQCTCGHRFIDHLIIPPRRCRLCGCGSYVDAGPSGPTPVLEPELSIWRAAKYHDPSRRYFVRRGDVMLTYDDDATIAQTQSAISVFPSPDGMQCLEAPVSQYASLFSRNFTLLEGVRMDLSTLHATLTAKGCSPSLVARCDTPKKAATLASIIDYLASALKIYGPTLLALAEQLFTILVPITPTPIPNPTPKLVDSEQSKRLTAKGCPAQLLTCGLNWDKIEELHDVLIKDGAAIASDAWQMVADIEAIFAAP